MIVALPITSRYQPPLSQTCPAAATSIAPKMNGSLEAGLR